MTLLYRAMKQTGISLFVFTLTLNINVHLGFPEETVIMYVGQYFVLSCDTDAQSYQWYKNSYPIASATNRNLLFNEFQLADEGHYSCKVNVNGKEIVTRLAHLKIGMYV